MTFKQRLIFWLYKAGYASEIQQCAQSNKGPRYKDKMRYMFTDSKGHDYFWFEDLNDMPLTMLEKLQELQMQLSAKIPGPDLDGWIEAVEKILNSEAKNKLTQVAHFVEALKERRAILFDPVLLMEIAALVYVREDENPCTYSSDLHKEKFDMLWVDSKEGALLYDFFHEGGLRSYMPLKGVTRQEWPQSLKEQMMKIQKFNTILSQVTTYVSKYGTEKMTAAKA